MSGWTFPAMHFVQFNIPGSGAILPEAHLRHSVSSVALSNLFTLPAVHCLQNLNLNRKKRSTMLECTRRGIFVLGQK